MGSVGSNYASAAIGACAGDVWAPLIGPRASSHRDHDQRVGGNALVGAREWKNSAVRAAGAEANVGRAGWGSTRRSAVPGTVEETPIRRAPKLGLGSGS